MRKSILLSLAAGVLLTACAVGPDYSQPLIETPEQYRVGEATQDSTLDLRWWDLFEDPVLYSLVTQALERLERRDEDDALAEALAAVESSQLEVKWK